MLIGLRITIYLTIFFQKHKLKVLIIKTFLALKNLNLRI